MKKKYLSPEFEFLEIDFVEDALAISDLGGSGSGGGGVDPFGPGNDPTEINGPEIF